MKLVKCHIENFGVISNEDFDFADGINTFIQDNGWGKSTLTEFIRCMFFGLEGTTKRTDYLNNDRVRFAPWNGNFFGGSLTFEKDGKTYRIERKFGNKDKEMSFKLYDDVTNIESSDFSDRIGEELFGVDSESFRQTCFIGTDAVKYVGVNSTVSAKVISLDQTGDLENYDEADKKLEKFLNINSSKRKTGKLSGLNKRISEINQDLKKLDATNEHIEAIKKNRDDVIGKLGAAKHLQKEYLDAQGRIIEQKEREININKEEIRKNQEELKKKQDELIKQQEELKSSRVEIERKEIEIVRKQIEVYKSNLENKRKNVEIEKNKIDAEIQEKAYQYEKNIGEFKQRGVELETEIENEKLAIKKVEHEEKNKKNAYKRNVAIGAVLGVVGLALLVCFFVTKTFVLLFGGIGFLVAFAIIALINVQNNPNKKGKINYYSRYEILMGDVKDNNKKIFEAEKEKNEFLALISKEFSDENAKYKLNQFGIRFDDYEIALDELNEMETEFEGYVKAHPEVDLYEESRAEGEFSSGEGEFERVGDSVETGAEDEFARAGENREASGEGKFAKAGDSVETSAEDEFARVGENREISGEGEFAKAGENREARAEGEFAKARDGAETSSETLSENPLESENSILEAENNISLIEAEASEKIEQLDVKLDEVNKKIANYSDLISGYDRELEGAYEEKDSLEELKDELEELTEEKTSLDARYKVVENTRAYLKEAKEQFVAQYIHPIKDRFEHYYAEVVGESTSESPNAADGNQKGNVSPTIKTSNGTISPSQFMMDANINLFKKEEGEYHGIWAQSEGYSDIIGFCMRIALLDIMYENEKPFVVMDDPFSGLDTRNMEGAKRLMRKVAEEYQIIYMTCHESRGI